jgi:hypothetical protein
MSHEINAMFEEFQAFETFTLRSEFFLLMLKIQPR